MRRIEGDIVYSATDMVRFLGCEHLTALDAMNLVAPLAPGEPDELDGIIQNLGLAHERAYLDALRAGGSTIDDLSEPRRQLTEQVEATRQALRNGADVIYQAALRDDAFAGYADFLERVDAPSELGDYSYEVVDTKLARSTKAGYLIQLCFYSSILATLQGRMPTFMHVVLGDGTRATYRVSDYIRYYHALKSRFITNRALHDVTYPVPCNQCGQCPWEHLCEEQWERDDHLSRVANIRMSQIRKLVVAGVKTLEALANLPEDARIAKLAPDTLNALRQELLKHFDGKPAFRAFRSGWTTEDEQLFCRLARAVHSAGLDWWHTGKGIQVRFGRKSPGTERAVAVLGIVRGSKQRKLTWTRPIGTIEKQHRVPITDDVVATIEAVLPAESSELRKWFEPDTTRPGLWPDQLREDPPGDDDADDEMTTSHAETLPINRIYYGPPGTGKTYTLSRLLRKYYEQSTSSITADQWRAQLIADRIAGLTWWEGTVAALYALGGRADVTAIMGHPFIQAIASAKPQNRNVRATLWANLQMHARPDSDTVKYVKRLSPMVFDKDSDGTWYLLDGWRDQAADVAALVDQFDGAPPADDSVTKRYVFTTFHQSYGYEDFVEGLRPVLADDAEGAEVRYEIRPGVFKELCRRARAEPQQRFAMIVDEINRGNISKIFGELITLIERDKRAGGENALSVTLPYSGEQFSVPSNVDIIGTMNTADRSLALLDTALRRRFDFEPLYPNSSDDDGAPLGGLRVTVGSDVINIPRLLEALNLRIEALYDRDHCIGHAYFSPLFAVPDGAERFALLQYIFANKIRPLLEEYFFEDWQKIRLVLADNQKPLQAQFFLEVADAEGDLDRLFGAGHTLERYSTKRRYSIQEAALAEPLAYSGIYSTLSP